MRDVAGDYDNRVLVLAPTGRDAEAIIDVIGRANITAASCSSMDDLIRCLRDGAGSVFIAEEALRKGMEDLKEWLDTQPAWSDLPIVVLSSKVDVPSVRTWRQRIIASLRNVTLLERPVQAVTLFSTLSFALKSRQRQYELREHLAEQDRVAERLEELVRERTLELRRANELLQEQIAERDRIADQLRHAQRMEAVGQLTGGVAHDFNNLLMVISGGLNMLERRPERHGEIIDAMKKATARGTGLTHQLLAFSRRQALKPEPIDLKTYFHELADLLDRTLRGDVEVVTEIAPDVWPISADAGELQLAIMNLCVNARDAMPTGGHIVIKVANQPHAENDPSGKDFVCISVADEGVGMSSATLSKVFEPFFTTKDIGKGSGLGLAQVHGYVTQSGGSVQISSAVGKGTTVSLCLPRSEDVPHVPAKSTIPATKWDQSKGRVLVVEDDDQLAELVTDMIGELGYQVTRASTAAAALDLLEGETVDVVFSDVMMPGNMDGLQLSREIRHRHPHVPVLLTSGYAEVIRRTMSASDVRILPKPYQLEELGAALERLRREASRTSPLH
jgi:signal transduction histidine kinase/CheY-like chemotaxis protein